MSRTEWFIEIMAMAIVILLWSITLFSSDPAWFVIALIGSAAILFLLCRLALRKD